MFNFFWYILKVSVCLITFYIFYGVFLRKNTFFFLNRLYLITGLILSFIIPILELSIFKGQSVSLLSGIANTRIADAEYDYFQIQNLQNNATSINYQIIMSVVYFAGILILFFKLLFSIGKVVRLKNSSEIEQWGRYKIVKTDDVLPFSFFNFIFLPKNESQQMIIEHEKAHISQFHWFDLILIEIVALLLWFNPFVILYKSSLKLQHEYLADNKVVKNNNRIESYLGCMLQQVQVVSSGRLISQFYCKTIKKRIVMITKNKTSVKYIGFYLLVLPLIGILFAFTGKNPNLLTKSDAGGSYVPSICPIDADNVKKSNGYGEWTNPITKKKEFHYGIDFAAPEGEKVVSTADGIVIEAKFDKKQKKGNYIIIRHNDEFSTFYSHLKSIAIKEGDKVVKGQTIGLVGNTGASTGPHLHYEVHKNGERVNPKDFMPK